jgi:hypothetical protein
VHHFGKFTSQKQAVGWIADHLWLTEPPLPCLPKLPSRIRIEQYWTVMGQAYVGAVYDVATLKDGKTEYWVAATRPKDMIREPSFAYRGVEFQVEQQKANIAGQKIAMNGSPRWRPS